MIQKRAKKGKKENSLFPCGIAKKFKFGIKPKILSKPAI